MDIFLGILLLLSAIFLIVAVLLQSSKSKGTGVVTGGAETFFGKNKGKSIDKKLSTLTIIVAIVFVILSIIVFVRQDYSVPDTDSEKNESSTDSGSDMDFDYDCDFDDAFDFDSDFDSDSSK